MGGAGDSGSPVWVWNDSTGQYEYLNALQSGGGTMTQNRGSCEYTVNTMDSYNKEVDMEDATVVGETTVAYINGVTNQSDTTITDSLNNVSTTPWSGTVTDAEGNELQQFVGVQSGINTWNDLSALKDTDNWYAYGADYLNASSSGAGKDLNYADLYMTENLVFQAGAAENAIIVNADVDLGIGYVQLSKGKQENASFTISGEHILNSAGYVVDAGVDLHLQLSGSQNTLAEWRKIGDGNLYIEGSGDNNILLNLGGDGTTYLNREGGYAAYNVLANNGTTVVISDTNQIRRDFTFGYRGGVLDMNGQSMEWNNDNAPEAAGFTIHALDESAIITNAKAGTTTTLTWTQGGDQTWLGSFRDTAEGGALKFVYNGGAGSTLTMHGIYTNLAQEDSGMVVQSGTLKLEGVNTVHGKGSVDGRDANRLERSNDWHYADMASDVEVQSGATLELGSHARLTGDVTVKDGGTYIMREGVQKRYEYIEGGQTLEDTYAIRDYYGHHGNTVLEGNSVLQVAFSEGTASSLAYAGNITGTGSMIVQAGSAEGSLILAGKNTFSGTKEVVLGGVIATQLESLGDTSSHKWVVRDQAYLAIGEEGNLLDYVDSSSTGVLALMTDQTTQLDLSTHQNLIIGALEGHTVAYGEAGTSETLNAVNQQWVLGGGGGELVVNYKLTGDNDLVLGSTQTHGVVTLTNTENDFTGNIIFTGGVTLSYEEGALGRSTLDLEYTNRLMMVGSAPNMKEDSMGVLLVDREAGQDLNLLATPEVVVGSQWDTTYTGTLTVQDTYRLGGSSATFTVASELTGNKNLVVDGQGYAGGTVVLTNAQGLAGQITVMGYDDKRMLETPAEYGATLVLGQDGILDTVAGVTLERGGKLDIGSTSQTLSSSLYTGEGSSLVGAEGGQLTILANAAYTLDASVDVETLVKADSGTLTLYDGVKSDVFRVAEGTVVLGTQTALSKVGTLALADGITMTVEDFDVEGHIIAESGTATLNVLQSYKLLGDIGAAEGATLVLQSHPYRGVTEQSGDWLHMHGSTINSDGGNLDIRVGRIYLANEAYGGETTVGGTMMVHNQDVELNAQKNQAVTLDHLDVAAGRTINLTGTWLNANTEWAIHQLTGEGNLVWDVSSAHANGTRLVLDGENTFSGVIQLKEDSQYLPSNTGYQAVLELAHDQAAEHAVISLQGDAGKNSMATLAINTENALLQGLEGNANAYVYAGASADDTSLVTAAPESNRQAQLTILGSGNYTYSGAIGANAATGNGIHLVMDGTGVQTLDGSDVHLSALTVRQGEVRINAAGVAIDQEIHLERGGSLSLISGSLSLGEGLVLSVGSQSTDAAWLKGGLTLQGGKLAFDVSSLTSETAALQGISSVTPGVSSPLEVMFSSANILEMGVTYQLASGDWSAVGALSAATGMDDYLRTTFSATSTGLGVTFSLAEDALLWRGTASQDAWNDSLFGQDTVTASFSSALFTDTAAYKEVVVEGAHAVERMTFCHDEAYTVAAGANGGSLETGYFGKQGEGALSLATDLKVTGDAELQGGSVSIAGKMEVLGAWRLADEAQVSVTGELALHLGEAGEISMKNLDTTAGTLTLDTASALTWTDTPLKADTLNLTGGSLSVKGTDGIVLNTLNLGDGAALSLYNKTAASGATHHLGEAFLGSGSILGIYSQAVPTSATMLGSLVLAGDATVKTLAKGYGSWWSIQSLSLAEGVASATLDLTSEHQSTTHAVFDLGNGAEDVGNFTGVIRVKANGATGAGGWRNTTLVISDADIASGAVVSFSTPTCPTTIVSLGVHADTVTIAGLESSSSAWGGRLSVYSGTIAGTASGTPASFTNEWVQDAALRTLAINTAAGTDYSYYGDIRENVNILKQGEGKQQLLGTAHESFNGSIAVEAGTLVFNNSSAGMLATASSVSLGHGATLLMDSRALPTAAATIPDLLLGGDATLDGSTGYGNWWNIQSLTMADGVGQATLNLISHHRTTTHTVFDLGGGSGGSGNFVGTIKVKPQGATANLGGGWRHTTLVLSDGEIARNAVISFSQPSSGTTQASLGVHADTVTIAGLESGSAWGNRMTVYSGVIPAENGDRVSSFQDDWVEDRVLRTLAINTAAGTDYSYYGDIRKNVNLLKQGEGIQQLLGTVSGFDGEEGFNGSVEVEGGTLVVGNKAADMLNTASSVWVEEGATLRLDGTWSGEVGGASVATGLGQLTGTGTLELALSTTWTNTLAVGSGFTGETYVTAGNMTVNASTFGETLRLADGANMQLTGGSTVTFDKDLVLEGSTQVHQNSDANLTVTGSVAGEGTYERRGGGTLRFQGGMDLGGYAQKTSSKTLNSYIEGGSAHIGTLTHSQGRLGVTAGTELAVDTLVESASGGLELEQGAKLTVGGLTITGAAASGARVKGDASVYAAANAAYTISQSEVAYTGEGDVVVANQLVGVDARNASSNGGSLYIDLSTEGTQLNSVVAESGHIRLINTPEQIVALQKLATVDSGLVISASTASLARSVEGAAEIGVTQEVDLAAGTTLEASLSVGQGAMLDLGGAVSMSGNSLTLGNGLVLGDKLEAALENLAPMGSLTLFTEVGSLYVGDEETTTVLLGGSPVLASTVLTSPVLGEAYVLTYSSESGSGTLAIQLVPEPATSTLGLLALASLAARRRRG